MPELPHCSPQTFYLLADKLLSLLPVGQRKREGRAYTKDIGILPSHSIFIIYIKEILTVSSLLPVSLRYCKVTWSTGKKPIVAPYSGDIFAMVALSAKDSSLMPSPMHHQRKSSENEVDSDVTNGFAMNSSRDYHKTQQTCQQHHAFSTFVSQSGPGPWLWHHHVIFQIAWTQRHQARPCSWAVQLKAELIQNCKYKLSQY